MGVAQKLKMANYCPKRSCLADHLVYCRDHGISPSAAFLRRLIFSELGLYYQLLNSQLYYLQKSKTVCDG